MPKRTKILRDTWPRVRRLIVAGAVKFQVDSRKTGFSAGRREWWDSEAQALASAELIAKQKDNEGAASFAELAPAERRDAAEALAHLDGIGTLLEAAIAFREETKRKARLAQIPTVDEAIDSYLAAKRAEAKTGDITRLTLYEIESKMRIVRANFGPLKVSEIDEAAVAAFIRKLPHAKGGKANIRKKFGQFLNYCRREGKWITVNPAENIKVKVAKSDVKILTVEAAGTLLKSAKGCDKPASVVPYIAVQLFGGLRPYEAQRLRWEQVHLETKQLEVLAATSKTRETRFVAMDPLLIEWLLAYRKPHGSICGSGFRAALRKVKQSAGFTFGEDQSNAWVKDILRHSYGSYWLAVHKDRSHLAELMGTSLAMIKTHYRRAIPEPVAKKFWTLKPAKAPGKIIPFTSQDRRPGLLARPKALTKDMPTPYAHNKSGFDRSQATETKAW